MEKDKNQKEILSPESMDYFIKEVTERLEKKVGELEEAKLGLKQEVEKRTKDLQDKVKELERFRKFTIDREIKMIELKKEIESLKEEVNSKK